MFKQMFASMNQALEEIMMQMPDSDDSSRAELEERLALLKTMSDVCMEEWLLFEEKLAQLSGSSSKVKETAIAAMESIDDSPHQCRFSKGQGYYKLYMFHHAIEEFQQVLLSQPDDMLARIYLAMSYLQCGDHSESYRQFKFVVPLTDDQKIKAISYNAMGCIQAGKQNIDKALEYFKLAHSADSATIEPVLNPAIWGLRH